MQREAIIMQKQARILGVRCGISLIVWLSLIQSVAAASLTFTDWMNINTTTDVAVGTLGSVGVTLSGQDILAGVTDGSFTGFNHPFFTPPLAMSDVLQLRGPNPPSTDTYTVTFSTPVTAPRLHLNSLASTLTFSTPPTKLSGQADFVVAGNTVTGALHDGVSPNDSNGTIELLGTFSSFTFTAQAIGVFGTVGDGFNLQIGADISAIPEPGTLVLLTTGIIGLLGYGWWRHRTA
jgi:small-conductance mechanosensitive channel